MEPSHALQPAPSPPYRGYAGWLQLFCVVQIYINPILLLIFVIPKMLRLSQVSRDLAGFAVVDFMLLIGVTGFGMHAGIRLRRLQSGAVGIAKGYLLTVLALPFVRVFLGIIFYLGGVDSNLSRFEPPVQFFSRVLFVVIWFSYFWFSKRIKVTFPSAPPSTAAPPQRRL